MNSLIFNTSSSDKSFTRFDDGILIFYKFFLKNVNLFHEYKLSAILTTLFCGMFIPAIRAINYMSFKFPAYLYCLII